MIKYTVLLFLLVIAIWASSIWAISSVDTFNSWQDRGAFGDTFGSINSLFSGLAFAGVLIAIIQQHKEIIAQDRHIKDQKAALESEKIQNRFFKILGIYTRVIESMSDSEFKTNLGSSFQGISCFKGIYIHLKSEQFKIIESNPALDYSIDFNEYYTKFWERNISPLSRYVEAAVLLMEFIQQSDDPTFYSGIFNSQLSIYERSFLWYHSQSDLDTKNLLELFVSCDLHRKMSLKHFYCEEDYARFVRQMNSSTSVSSRIPQKEN